MCLLVSLSCAAGSIAPEQMRSITGFWQTEQDIVVEIGPADGGGFEATIVYAPGFATGDNRAGSVILTGIRAQADGTFTGTFQVPGAEPASVRMGFSSPDNLMIVTFDGRRWGGSMVWHRARKNPAHPL